MSYDIISFLTLFQMYSLDIYIQVVISNYDMIPLAIITTAFLLIDMLLIAFVPFNPMSSSTLRNRNYLYCHKIKSAIITPHNKAYSIYHASLFILKASSLLAFACMSAAAYILLMHTYKESDFPCNCNEHSNAHLPSSTFTDF